ncbi:MAG: hypothetical protein WKG03_07680 [Telluria sp.]
METHMSSTWQPSLESWGLPTYLSADIPGVHNDIGPVAIGRVFGTDMVPVDAALYRVAAVGVSARQPVPCRALAAASGVAIRSHDTRAASMQQPVELASSIRVSHCLGSGEAEPPVVAQHTQLVEPSTFLLPGADAVLTLTSPYYKGSQIREKSEKKIIQAVPPGTDVVGVGSDMLQGSQLLYEGRRISAGDIAALCMAGVQEIEVFARPKLAVCVIHRYYAATEKQGTGAALPDGLTPMVLAVLKRWGVQVDTVRHVDLTGQAFNQTASREINAIAEEHDLTIVLGFLGDDSEMDKLESARKMPPIAEPVFNPESSNGSYSLKRGMYRPADIARVMIGGAYWIEHPRTDRCKLLIALQGLPLPVYTAMYTVVKPALDAVSGVGAFPVMGANHFGFGSPKSRDFDNDKRRKLLSRAENGMSGTHGVLWLTGVLATPAPRDPQRHWLQLAKIVRNETGHTSLHVLPSEEYQVSGLIGAQAMPV